jgi:hypothetical protein
MKIVAITNVALVSCGIAMSCGSPAGTQPHAMSAAEHEAAATQEEQASSAHGAQYEPGASQTRKSCSPTRGGASTCWTSQVNPTAEHAEQEAHHKELAARHRAASESLRSVEVSACAGISESDRDISPFAHREDIRSITPLREEVKAGRAVSFRLSGAEVTFRSLPGMTAEWLKRVGDCHLARNSAIGHEVSGLEMPYCPLTVRGAQASVRSVGDGFVLAVRADDEAAAQEILRRAQSLSRAQ